MLAHSRGRQGRLSDLRVVATDGHQIPYLIENPDEPLPVDVQLSPLVELPGGPRPAGQSHYQLGLPYQGLPDARLVLETSARVFRRRVQVAVERPADRRHRDRWLDVVAEAEWYHGSHDLPAPALLLPLGELDAVSVVVTIDEGDNSPLAITAARLLLPSYRVRFFHPEDGAAATASIRSGAANVVRHGRGGA